VNADLPPQRRYHHHYPAHCRDDQRSYQVFGSVNEQQDEPAYHDRGNAKEKRACPFGAAAHIHVRESTQANADEDINERPNAEKEEGNKGVD